MIKKIALLIQFMTRIPIFFKVEYDEETLGKSLKYFPLIGFFIGIILYYICLVCLKILGIHEKSQLISIILIISEIFLVGIIHIDGLADTFDGLFSYRKKEEILEIMKDSRIGTNGTVILILYFLVKFILLNNIIIENNLKFIILFPIIARLSTVVNAGLSKYARKKGMSNSFIDKTEKKDVLYSIIFTIILSFVILKIKGIIACFVGIIFILYFMKEVQKKIDGVTGDTMGASLELTSLLILLVGVVLK